LPKAMFISTPISFSSVANLEKPLYIPRPPFLAPVGTKNVAVGKPVTSSDSNPIVGQLNYITDNDKETSDGHYVELAPGRQYVTIDLEGLYNIYAIIIWHDFRSPDVYYDVVVQVADDPLFIEKVQTVFNNDNDNSLGLGVGSDKHYIETNEGKLIDTKGIKGRYIRLYSNSSFRDKLRFNHYIEVAVYGISITPSALVPVEIELPRPHSI